MNDIKFSHEEIKDLMQKIARTENNTKSDKLLPEEIKKRETRLTDYATT